MSFKVKYANIIFHFVRKYYNMSFLNIYNDTAIYIPINYINFWMLYIKCEI